ncbi:phenylacetate-CoA oxygenase, PaaJ subunit [Luminiphilus syltensis NOR5-1B]|uniref:Phenylacetate-CoA oxygenase, PaaJ subunit n=1 Tax=Luminiphilus syltensis NOR5-1B TaxID=565045 RepID=B8KT78_9GAMM|nr:1,2-phenylacetyl-CoA epoxidase subunit PaaD [Luminiphilus syltensis]EED35920.1 phenylacetate-CoA oxygenase, PaaJ subunit [Luminiphilus syltensis NOR5-1B]
MVVDEANVIPLLPVEELERRQRRINSECPDLWRILDDVMDPEIPVISLYELGVLQDVSERDGHVHVLLTPTYVGCPAMKVMEEDARIALEAAGYPDVTVETRLSPAWTTAWLSNEARSKMAAYGIAAPDSEAAQCPQCGSEDVQQISEFGSTACKALFKCNACAEPFDLFKAI